MAGEVVLRSFLVPVADIPVEDRIRVIRATLWKISELARMVTSLKGLSLVGRPLVGTDFGLTGHGWAETVSATVGSAQTYEDSGINATTGNDRYIGIYGVYLASSWDSVLGIRWVVGGKRAHAWDFQSILHEQPYWQNRADRTLFVYPSADGDVDPVLIPPRTSVLMQQYVRGGSAVGIQPSEIIPLGIVVEPSGGGGAGVQAQSESNAVSGSNFQPGASLRR